MLSGKGEAALIRGDRRDHPRAPLRRIGIVLDESRRHSGPRHDRRWPLPVLRRRAPSLISRANPRLGWLFLSRTLIANPACLGTSAPCLRRLATSTCSPSTASSTTSSSFPRTSPRVSAYPSWSPSCSAPSTGLLAS